MTMEAAFWQQHKTPDLWRTESKVKSFFHRCLQPLYTEKTQGFVPLLPPHVQHKPHATFMQSLQCILQHHVANVHLSTHMATPDDNNHAATPMRTAITPLPFVTTSCRHHFPLSSDVKFHTTLH